jgi:hypothetical protein
MRAERSLAPLVHTNFIDFETPIGRRATAIDVPNAARRTADESRALRNLHCVIDLPFVGHRAEKQALFWTLPYKRNFGETAVTLRTSTSTTLLAASTIEVLATTIGVSRDRGFGLRMILVDLTADSRIPESSCGCSVQRIHSH